MYKSMQALLTLRPSVGTLHMQKIGLWPKIPFIFKEVNPAGPNPPPPKSPTDMIESQQKVDVEEGRYCIRSI